VWKFQFERKVLKQINSNSLSLFSWYNMEELEEKLEFNEENIYDDTSTLIIYKKTDAFHQY
jgi:hypothetical protein